MFTELPSTIMPELQHTPTNDLSLVVRLPSPGFLRQVGQPSEVPVYLRICCCKCGQAVPVRSYPSSGAGKTGVLRLEQSTPGSASVVGR